jgi:hypothetical protein
LRGAALFALAALLALAFAGAAQAVNSVPNPGFETASAGDPCIPNQWSPLGGSFGSCVGPILRDTVVFHAGSASMKIGVDQQSVSNTPDISDCFTLTAGNANTSYWYRTDDATVSGTQFVVHSYSTPDCKGSPATQTLNVSASGGAWQHVTGVLTFPAGTGSGRVQLGMTCSCGAPSIINFDDVSIDPANPTAAAVTSFSASRTSAGVIVRWRTGSEAGLLGFRVYRGGRLLSRRMLPASQGVAGRAYSYRDRSAPMARLTYRIDVVGLDGASRRLGSISIR